MTNIIAYSTIVREDSSSVDENSERGRVSDDQEGFDEELGVGNLVRSGAKPTTLFSGFGKGYLSFDRSANSAGSSSGLKGVISSGSSVSIKVEEENRRSMGVFDLKPPIFPHHVDAELSAAGWPHWLIAVAGEAIRGLVPRRADDFEKLERVEQLLGIYELCGSPSEEYWNRSKLPYATLLKPQRPYKRCIAETFNNFPPSLLPLIETLLAIDPAECQSATAALMSEFFTTEPFVPYPSNLLHISPSKEMDGKP